MARGTVTVWTQHQIPNVFIQGNACHKFFIDIRKLLCVNQIVNENEIFIASYHSNGPQEAQCHKMENGRKLQLLCSVVPFVKSIVNREVF